MELFRKPGNWRQICQQTSSYFNTSNDVSLKRAGKKKLLGRHNKDISLFFFFFLFIYYFFKGDKFTKFTYTIKKQLWKNFAMLIYVNCLKRRHQKENTKSNVATKGWN